MATKRRRVAATIRRGDSVLRIRERGVGPTGRHDGDEHWALSGGGIETGEGARAALVREVAEEVGLSVLIARHQFDSPYPSGVTAVFDVQVDGGEPHLGSRAPLTGARLRRSRPPRRAPGPARSSSRSRT